MRAVRAELVRDEEEDVEADLDQTSLPNQQRPPPETFGPEGSNCFACDQPDSWDNMVMCDGPHEEQWYHLRCVGIERLSSNGTQAILGLTA